MAFKFVIFFAIVAVARGGVIGYDSHSAYSAAPSVSYSSVSVPAVSHVPSPVYAKGATSAYAASPYRVAASAYRAAAPVAYAKNVEEYAPAHYDFGYGVEDPHTGDVKSHQETREGDVVKGSYSLIEADGSKRIVEYTVDPHSGFNAVVHKVAGAAPAYAKVAAPGSYAAPLSAHTYAAPAVAKVALPVTKGYSVAPSVSYSSVSAPVAAHSTPYYH
ncbi:hypothetical protein JTB14_009191 [Gonioctena quinquepunctata]|nr:hypothetical protein JTB14_009191 [Gonioctena quinquepunctata]